MIRIEVELHEDIVSVLQKLKSANDTNVELFVPEGAVLFDNILNLKLLEKWASQEERVINFQTDDPNGQNLLSSLEEKEAADEEPSEEIIETLEDAVPPQKINLPKRRLTLPVIKLKRGKILLVLFLLLAFLGLIGAIAYQKISGMPVANIKIIVNSQPLIRSFEIKLKNGVETSPENKLLKGTTLETNLEDEVVVETTGIKMIGEKAEGRVTIYNKTDEDKKFKKGTTLVFEDDDDTEYEFVTQDDVPVPAREEQPDPENVEMLIYIKGSAEVDVTAKNIGKKYNLDEGEDLTIDGEKKSEFEVEVKKDISGGKEEEIKIVSQEDIDSALQKLLEKSEESALRVLGQKIGSDQRLISGSETVSVIKEVFSHKLDDETEELKLSQTFSARGLVYAPTDLDAVVDTLVESFVDEGYVLSTKERSVNVEVLGNTETTVLNDTEADLQVTLKTFTITDISEEMIRNEIMGKSVADAQKYLGSIRNVKTFELSLDQRIPMFDYIPKDVERVVINLERE